MNENNLYYLFCVLALLFFGKSEGTKKEENAKANEKELNKIEGDLKERMKKDDN